MIGNLIYYRFINAAIVAPDAFDIIAPEKELLTNTQRHNLASIAKILQFAASKKGVRILYCNQFLCNDKYHFDMGYSSAGNFCIPVINTYES